MKLNDALKILKPYLNRMIFIMLLSVLISGISVVTPFVNQNMIDNGLLQGDTKTVIYLIILLVVLQVGGQGIEYLQRRQEISITNELGKKLKTEAFEHGLKLKPHYFKEQGFYKTLGDALYDISNIMSITDNSFLVIFVIICKCIGASAGLIILDWRLSTFIAAIIPIKVWLNLIMRKRAEQHGEQLMKDNQSYNSWFSNILYGVNDIKLWNLKRKTTNEYVEHVQILNESSKQMSLMQAKNNLLTTSLELILMNVLYIVGAFLIKGEQITFGQLIAFISFASYVLAPINIIMQLRIILKQIAPSVKSIKHFNSLEEENYSASLPLATKVSTIEFNNVSVSLGGRDILSNFNMRINRGEKVAIIGDNGSGKTTIINLLLRLCEPTEGEILIDGIPANAYNIEDYRKKFSVVTQDIHLFKGTVKENIIFDEKANIAFDKDERLKFCTEVIESLDRHYETPVGNEGTMLSGGERQKIALLRALYRNSEILILDEPTSNYDKESEEKFNQYIRESVDYDFYFVVTHSNNILSSMDKVLIVESGQVRACSI